ncbi:ArsR family transcriptional regulator [Actinoplanes sp. NPDC049599]|uniref:arsenate reductase/protein-tyrosine-phosphatase family protein n=1 Tax=Actinoplanes sp. NPDC049599 TaxID=3363903 RepID=UPI00378C5002
MVSPSQPAPDFVRLAGHPLRWRMLTELARGDLRVRELVALLGEPQSLVSYHLRLLRSGGLVTAGRSSFDGRDSYYHLDLDRCAEALADTGAALHPMLRPPPPPPPPPPEVTVPVGVLFVCTGNSARSPIAEALLRHRTGGRVAVASAGISPKAALHPEAVRALREGFGIDLAGQSPRPLAAVLDRRFDHVISLCDKAREALTDLPGRPRLAHWSIADPAAAAGAGHRAFRNTAAEIDNRVRHLVPVLAATHPVKEIQP